MYSGYGRNIFLAGIILFYGFTWLFNTVLYAGSLALFSSYAPELMRRQGERVHFLASLLSTILSIALVMWMGWLASGGRWGYLFLVIYTLLAVVMELSTAHDGASDSDNTTGNLLGHLFNMVLWGSVWYFG